jgi:hypothetical protein
MFITLVRTVNQWLKSDPFGSRPYAPSSFIKIHFHIIPMCTSRFRDDSYPFLRTRFYVFLCNDMANKAENVYSILEDVCFL